MNTILLLTLAVVVFFGKKKIPNETIERIGNILTIVLVVSGLLSVPINFAQNTENATATADHFSAISNPVSYEFLVDPHFVTTSGFCPAREFSATLEEGTHLLMEYHLESVSPNYYYYFEISGPDFIKVFRLEGIDYYFLDHFIENSGKYKVVFSYCAAYTLRGKIKFSEGYWNAIDLEIEDTTH
jgi:hypothetical protein